MNFYLKFKSFIQVKDVICKLAAILLRGQYVKAMIYWALLTAASLTFHGSHWFILLWLTMYRAMAAPPATHPPPLKANVL